MAMAAAREGLRSNDRSRTRFGNPAGLGEISNPVFQLCEQLLATEFAVAISPPT